MPPIEIEEKVSGYKKYFSSFDSIKELKELKNTIINCPNCGGHISYEGGKHCEYCDTWFERPRIIREGSISIPPSQVVR